MTIYQIVESVFGNRKWLLQDIELNIPSIMGYNYDFRPLAMKVYCSNPSSMPDETNI